MTRREPTFSPSAFPAFQADDPNADSKTLEAQHVGVVRRFYMAIERQDWALLGESLTDDITIELFGSLELPHMRCTGREAVLAMLRDNISAVESSRSEIETLAAQGHLALCICNDRGVLKGSGETYEVKFLVHFDFRNGFISRARQWILPTA